jgi:hypothetical protein
MRIVRELMDGTSEEVLMPTSDVEVIRGQQADGYEREFGPGEAEMARTGRIETVTRVERFGRTTRVVEMKVVRSYRGPVRGE